MFSGVHAIIPGGSKVDAMAGGAAWGFERERTRERGGRGVLRCLEMCVRSYLAAVLWTACTCV